MQIHGGEGNLLCQPCWSVLSPHPWPAEDEENDDGTGLSSDLARTSQQVLPLFGKDVERTYNSTMDASDHGVSEFHGRPSVAKIKRAQSMVENGKGWEVPTSNVIGRPGVGTKRQPSSMPEAPLLLSGSSGDPRWGALASTMIGTSAPSRRQGFLSYEGRGSQIHTISPQEFRNMLDEESLELFESQSHLFDSDSRLALKRQRQLLQWQNGINQVNMDSMLERQDSAESGAGDVYGNDTACDAKSNRKNSNSLLKCNEPNSDTVEASDFSRKRLPQENMKCCSECKMDRTFLVHELQESKRHLAVVQKECESLSNRVKQLEAELVMQKEATKCKICHKVKCNLVWLAQ